MIIRCRFGSLAILVSEKTVYFSIEHFECRGHQNSTPAFQTGCKPKTENCCLIRTPNPSRNRTSSPSPNLAKHITRTTREPGVSGKKLRTRGDDIPYEGSGPHRSYDAAKNHTEIGHKNFICPGIAVIVFSWGIADADLRKISGKMWRTSQKNENVFLILKGVFVSRF